jgi:nitric oxide synthase oxygenase domain/subunit
MAFFRLRSEVELYLNDFLLCQLCLKLGWKSKRTKHDILPLLLSANGADPELFVIPPEIVMEVQLTHPE